MFFVLNVGRSGSRTIAQVLSQSPSCTCLHEPEPLLLAELHGYRAGTVAHDELVEALRTSRREDEEEVCGESSNRLALGVPALRDAFPDASYLWLVRDGRAMVSSAMQRGWYDRDEADTDWARYRPTGPLLGDMDDEEWASLDQFERLCWYWDRVNRLLREDVADEQPLLVRLETLDQQLPAIVDHLSLEPTSFTVTKANRRYTDTEAPPPGAKRSNRVERLFTPSDWSSSQHEQFERRCGSLMDELYPGWRGTGPDEWSVPAARGDVAEVLAAIREEIAESGVRAADLRDAQRERRALQSALDDARQDLREAGAKLAEHDELLERVDDAESRAARAFDAGTASVAPELHAYEAEVARLTALVVESSGDRDAMQTELAELRDRAFQLDRQLGRERARRQRIESMRAYRSARRLGDIRGRVRARVLDLLRLVVHGLPASAAQRVRDLAVALRRRRQLRPALAALPDVERLIEIPVGDGRPQSAPTVAVVAVEVDDAQLDELLASLRELQVRLRFAPLLVTDTGAFPRLRDAGVLFEYVPPRDDWELGEPGASYDAFVRARIADLVQVYRPDIVVPLDLRPRTAATSLAALRAAVEDVVARRVSLDAAVAAVATTEPAAAG